MVENANRYFRRKTSLKFIVFIIIIPNSMTFSAQFPVATQTSELVQARQRLINTRALLLQICRDLDAQIAALEGISSKSSMTPVEKVAPPPPTLFETQPVNIKQAPAADITPASSRVIKASAPAALDPELEQATLEELNSALSKAFSQIASRSQW